MRQGSALSWVAILALLTVAIAAYLLATPEVALQYWYLLAAPLVAAAFRFGVAGAAVASAAGAFVLLAAFLAAGRAFPHMAAVLEQLILSSTSPDEARTFALELADLRISNPAAAFGRAVVGYGLVVVSSLLMGRVVDARDRTARALANALRLRSYVSPQVIEVVSRLGPEGQATPVSARKEVTLLFCDLRGFTGTAERMEPEDVIRVLNHYLATMTEAIVERDGTLDKYLGDGIMAFFGDPVWQPDHAERAVRAALAMQERFTQLQSRWQAEGIAVAGMGIGLSTGYVTIGNVGSSILMGYTAVGSTVNVAARLSELAKEGQILATPKTYWRVQRAVSGVVREPVQVKGFPHPVEIVEILGARAAAQPRGPGLATRVAEIVTRVVDDPSYRAVLLSSAELTVGGRNRDEQALAYRVAVLCGYPTFQGIPGPEMALLVANASVESYGPGTVVVHQGAVEEKFYVVLQGEVVVTALDEQSRPLHVASLGRGDHFGEVALLFDAPRMATVQTVSESQLLVLRRDGFYALLEGAPTLRARIEEAARRRATAPQPNAVA